MSLIIRDDGPVRYLVLDRPQASNAFDANLLMGLCGAVGEAKVDAAVRIVVLAGNGRHFCAGADLAWMREALQKSDQENVADARSLYLLYSALRDFDKPLVACVHGAVFGGGVGLCAAADVVVADPCARFSVSEVRVGLAPVMMCPAMIEALGVRRAKELSLTGRVFTANEALDYGLIHFLSEDPTEGVGLGTGTSAALNLVIGNLLKGGPEALAATKKLYRDTLYRDWDALGPNLTELISSVRVGAEAQEGLKAFLEKKRPSWCAEKSKPGGTL